MVLLMKKTTTTVFLKRTMTTMMLLMKKTMKRRKRKKKTMTMTPWDFPSVPRCHLSIRRWVHTSATRSVPPWVTRLGFPSVPGYHRSAARLDFPSVPGYHQT